MTTLAESGPDLDPLTSEVGGREAGNWGLLLIPVMLCIGMMIFGLALSR